MVQVLQPVGMDLKFVMRQLGPDQPSVTVDVLYDSYAPIGGFQFNVESGTLVSASGGDATANGFTVSTGGNLVIGFSLTGSTIPAGSGTLVTLEIEGADSTCISDLVISDSSGSAIDYNLDCNSFTTLQVLEGCTDASACNYDENAILMMVLVLLQKKILIVMVIV